MNEEETIALEELKEEINTYMIHKFAVSTSMPQKIFLNIQDHFSVSRVTHTERSNVIYSGGSRNLERGGSALGARSATEDFGVATPTSRRMHA